MNKEVEEKTKSKSKLMNEHFIQFLKKKRLYSKFTRELRKDNGNTVSFYLESFLYKKFRYSQTMYLSGAFHWARSKDGHEFWSKVNEEWFEFTNETSYE